ncbi:MAG: hypothetical protein JWR56_67 [Massilia sp.]|nr:hypothetical protein [Massilia sp.]
MQITRPLIAAFMFLALGTASGQSAAADDLTDFSVRLPSALSKFSGAGDVVAVGGASAGSRYASGINPASLDWQPSLDQPWTISPQLTSIRFDHGPRLDVGSASVGRNLAGAGSVQLIAANIGNNGKQEGDFMLLQGNVAELQWGKKLNDELAVGVNLNYSRLNTKAGMGGFLLADGDTTTKGVRAGLLWGVSKKMLAGLVAEHAGSRYAADQFNPTCFCLMPVSEKGRSNLVRAGLSYEYADQSSLYLDYLASRFTSPSAALSDRTVFAGVEHRVTPGVFLRGGVARGMRGTLAGTVGFGFAPSNNWSIDIAYQHDMYAELHPEFGRAKVFNAGLNFAL